MSVVSYGSGILNNIFDINVENFDNQSILSVISDINKLKDIFEDYEKITTLKDFNIVGADVVELAPDYDASGSSTAVATKVIRELLMIM